jgi:hypothetical protein
MAKDTIDKIAINKYGSSIYDIEQVNAFKEGYKLAQETRNNGEIKWLDIFKEYTKDSDSNIFSFFNWLETNYNSPTKK